MLIKGKLRFELDIYNSGKYSTLDVYVDFFDPTKKGVFKNNRISIKVENLVFREKNSSIKNWNLTEDKFFELCYKRLLNLDLENLESKTKSSILRYFEREKQMTDNDTRKQNIQKLIKEMNSKNIIINVEVPDKN